jgi:hypothetical protein
MISNSLPDTADGIFSDRAYDAELLRRYPVLARPGPQPHNQIAGTLKEQLRRVFGPAGAPEWTRLAAICPPEPPPASPDDQARARILVLLGPSIADIAADVALAVYQEMAL